ncbi:hypothetical protein [Testudinibacter sp. TR-2022]|uniref:hypothetical protein n=1 Tax=Testudinibacter sp. TR-2022 TaxID=2585029 RepID=UPI00111B9C4B|nr:hypothetical protein [Testudinibacter sp. TR-2022]TNH05502.1 hypothetical protein FHQ30_10480 [Pasteurellaceae bacterium Phil11]TNH23179.1 hypothetical protein FHQ29_06110 [Testudinibacter sp. TR-2022]TNH23645.1 hypothetical protein FHQ27_11170 [Testudinibacter sp. TR-2022]
MQNNHEFKEIEDYNEKYKSIEHSHTDVTLEDEKTHIESLSKPSSQTDLWEETALGVVAESGDYDILLWSAGYILSGNGEGIWGDGLTAEREIQLIVIPRSQRGTMKNNDFVKAGWTPSERLSYEQLKVMAEQDKVTWDFNGLRFVAKPPEWALQGKAGGAEFDLHYKQIGTPLWNWGAFKDAHKSDRAGYDAFVSVDGRIDTGSQQLEFKNGYGVREHIITGQSNDPIKNLPAPNWMWWLYTIVNDVKINFFQVKDGFQLGFVKYDEDKQINISSQDHHIAFDITEKWEDPRTGMNLPVKWHLKMNAEGVEVDVAIAAHGRAYSHWPTAHGTRMYCYLLSTMTGMVKLPDGRTVELDNHLTVNSFCKTILTASETSNGAVAQKPV